MKEFNEYYTRNEVIKYLCKIRISYACRRHKKHLIDKLVDKSNHLPFLSTTYDDEIIEQLKEILPSRRLWITAGFNTYQRVFEKEDKIDYLRKIEADDKNRLILYNTIKIHSKYKIKHPYIARLDEFIKEIQEEIRCLNFKIGKIDIVPEIKETNKSKRKYFKKNGKKLECRPISRFYLKDRIVISLTNKFLTELFDEHFDESSLAFRAKDKFSGLEKNHHTAILRIIEYKRLNLSSELYVAECDMKKFFDTVNHTICKNAFENLVNKTKEKYPTLYLDEAIYLFYEYLNCYSFPDNVGKLNQNIEYWENQKDSHGSKIDGIYSWVEGEINKSEYYKLNDTDKIGVPQGGALSGLIANIMLDKADKTLKKIPDLFYVRYCDDMILMHENQAICEKAILTYKECINDLLLFNHPFSSTLFCSNKNYKGKLRLFPRWFFKYFKKLSFLNNINDYTEKWINTKYPNLLVRFKKVNSKKRSYSFKYSIKPFWNCKSKGPYKWGKLDIDNNIFPWIGFVGYEIDYKCNVRVRKRSINKELQKQQRVVTSIIKRIKKEDYRYKVARNNSIYRSAFEKLNGMAVGRVALYNYKFCENKMCWTDGFKCLNFNKYSKIQLRKLDRNKYKYLNILTHNLGAETAKSKNIDFNEETLKMGKPFSYYYHAGEKKNEV